MIEKIRKLLRLSTDQLDDEIQDLIDVAKADLSLAGITKIDETDPMISRAITVYVKANFGLDNPDSEKLNRSYEMIKNHLALSVEYTSEVI